MSIEILFLDEGGFVSSRLVSTKVFTDEEIKVFISDVENLFIGDFKEG